MIEDMRVNRFINFCSTNWADMRRAVSIEREVSEALDVNAFICSVTRFARIEVRRCYPLMARSSASSIACSTNRAASASEAESKR